MKKVKKPVFFLVFAVIAIFAITTLIGVSTQNGDIATTYVHGVKDIRLGIDIQGGVDVTFEPAGDVDATDEQMDAALDHRALTTVIPTLTTKAIGLLFGSHGRQGKRISIRNKP